MISRRGFLAASTALFLAIGGQHAFAKDGNGNGNGNGGGNGNGNGGGNGNGNSGGNGNGNNGNGNNGNGNGNGNAAGNNGQANGKSSNANASTKSTDDSRTGDAAAAPIAVRHRNGIEEVLAKGRYIMRDQRGRTIVNRPATSADRSRLNTLID